MAPVFFTEEAGHQTAVGSSGAAERTATCNGRGSRVPHGPRAEGVLRGDAGVASGRYARGNICRCDGEGVVTSLSPWILAIVPASVVAGVAPAGVVVF